MGARESYVGKALDVARGGRVAAGGHERAPKANVAWQLIAEVIPDARLTGCNGRPVPAVVDRAMYLVDGDMPLEHAADQVGLEPEALRRMIELLEPSLLTTNRACRSSDGHRREH